MLSAAELKVLGRLDLAYRRPVSGLNPGKRRSVRAARSPEFSDFRPYVPGDDYRQIDWLAFARLERLMLRLSVAEEEACLNIVLDTSASMLLGEPPKWLAVRKLAAALAFIGVSGMDRIQVGQFSERHIGPLHGRQGLTRVWAFLAALEPRGGVNSEQLGQLRWLRPGITVIISDFLVEAADWAAALAALRTRRQEAVLWQVLAPDEERPTLLGDLLLVDVESGRTLELTITRDLVRRYRLGLDEHRNLLAQAAQAAHGQFLHTVSTEDLAAPILAGLRAGVIRRG